jgi:hypothetical protein
VCHQSPPCLTLHQFEKEHTYLLIYLFLSFFLSFIIITLYTLGCCKQIYKSTTIVTTTIYFTNVCACKWFGRKNEGIDRVRKACVKIKDPWHFSKWEQAHYNTVADGELVDLNWYPPCENKWVSEWVSGWGGLPIDAHRIKTNEWKDWWVPTDTQQVKTKWESHLHWGYNWKTHPNPFAQNVQGMNRESPHCSIKVSH